jgi:hypothetical protein
MKTNNETKATHTPTPWHIEGLLSMDLSEGLKIENKNTIVAEICGGIPYDEALANAAFIVRAVNEYEVNKNLIECLYREVKEQKAINAALLEAAETCVVMLRARIKMHHMVGDDAVLSLLNSFDKAIAQAEGGRS